MKRMLAAALSAAAVLLCEAADIVVDWNNVSVKKAKQGETLFQSGKRGIGNLSDFGGENRGSARIENAQLTVDTTGYQNSRRHALLCFQGMPKYPGQMVQAEFDISCETDGRTIHFFFEGSRGDRKLHYWVKKSVTVTRNTQHIVLKELMPNDLKALRLRFDFLSPDVYRIGNISFGKTEEKETDRSINYLRNGGAERGFYCVMPPTDQRYRGTMNVVRDDKVFHSGKYSFRLEGKADCTYNRLVFGSVPFAIGKPATFSAWMKPGKPSKVEFMLFSAAGSAYIKTFNAGTEWAKYSFTVPNFGAKNMPGILTVGEPAKRPAMHLNPCITLEKNKANTVWVDDVCYQLDTKTEERTPAVYISGRLDEPCGYYRQNRPVKARVKFEASGSCKRAELEYELTGWRGERLLPVQKETLALPSEKEICLNVPPYYLGPMNLKLRVRAEGKVFTHNFYSGVISAEQLMNKRLGANISMRSREGCLVTANLLRDFGVGAVRAWSTDPGVNHLDVFRNAGFYVMLCLSVPHADVKKLPYGAQFFMPLDYSGYLGYLKEKIQKNYKGQVDLYEIFNEPNIWSGRNRNPDESKYCTASPEAVVDGTKKNSGMREGE